jgi:hypothetical protein
MDRQKLIMVVALIGWGLFVGTQVTKTFLLGKLDCSKCECPQKVEVEVTK